MPPVSNRRSLTVDDVGFILGNVIGSERYSKILNLYASIEDTEYLKTEDLLPIKLI